MRRLSPPTKACCSWCTPSPRLWLKAIREITSAPKLRGIGRGLDSELPACTQIQEVSSNGGGTDINGNAQR